ncbi:MAG TPA: hypothetical protein VF984_00585 [Actinomycetota bacterium]
MDAVQTLTNALVVTAVGAVLAWMLAGSRRESRDDIAQLRAEMAELRTDLRGEMAELRTELRSEMSELRVEVREEIRAVRSDLTQVALAVGVPPRAQNE